MIHKRYYMIAFPALERIETCLKKLKVILLSHDRAQNESKKKTGVINLR